MSLNRECVACGKVFPSRTKLFKHLWSNQNHMVNWNDCTYLYKCKTCSYEYHNLNGNGPYRHHIIWEPEWAGLDDKHIYAKECGQTVLY
jgi:hypothetical protein